MGKMEGRIAVGKWFIEVITYIKDLLRVVKGEGGARGEAEVFSWTPVEVEVKPGKKGSL
jgi:hypothetical protein